MSCLHFFDFIEKAMALDAFIIVIIRLFFRWVSIGDRKGTFKRIGRFKCSTKNSSIGLWGIKAASIDLAASVKVPSTVIHGWKEVDIHERVKSSIRTRWKRYIASLKGLLVLFFDGIFFHTYPLNEAEFVEQVAQSSTFAEHFFPVAAEHLNPGGVFTYLTNEIDSFSRPHQRALLDNTIQLTIVSLANALADAVT